MTDQLLRQSIEAFHQWRRPLLVSGHEVSGDDTDPLLVLSSKLLKVFLALHPDHRPQMSQLQVHFLDQDSTHRVQPEAWQEVLQQEANIS